MEALARKKEAEKQSTIPMEESEEKIWQLVEELMRLTLIRNSHLNTAGVIQSMSHSVCSLINVGNTFWI